ncbi:hypothetical protein [Zavarzinella formosa]|uniref:hypothetical protein n=1 Tax=Zavarzinella formosa TaxID=360055 RepID=UPI00030F11F8|nr:hypothetical protein [Zavarzinella formosa]
MFARTRMKRSSRLIAAMVILAGIGACEPAGPKTVPVKGTVTLEGGDVSLLAGHHVEGVLEGNPSVLASGVIQKDGVFALESLLEGKVRKGAMPGKYKARIVISDDVDDNGKRLPRPPLSKSFLRAETSGLSFEVSETSPDVQLALTARAK